MEYVDGASLRDVLKVLLTSCQSDQSVDAAVRAIQFRSDEASEVRFDQITDACTPEPQTVARPVDSGILTPEAQNLITSPDHIRRCCEIVRDVALALAHAHERGVIHRDLKPENLLLDRQERVHVIDFGLARFFEDMTLTNSGALVGTPLYMSPEQVSGRVRVDHRTDIYSLGIVLYELLTLQRPISAPTRERVLRQVVTKALPPVSRLNRSIPRDLESVVHKATAKDPDERYQSSVAFAADLDNVLSNKRVGAPFYRYRLDKREIAAERPTEIIVISFFVILFNLSIIYVTALFGILEGWAFRHNVSIIILSITAIASLVSSCYLLIGRKWARLLTATISGTLGLGLLAVSTGPAFRTIAAIRQRPLTGAIIVSMVLNNVVPMLLGLLALILVPLLYRRPIQSWFDFSEGLRSEHEQQAPRR
jgi:hypothetical protein